MSSDSKIHFTGKGFENYGSHIDITNANDKGVKLREASDSVSHLVLQPHLSQSPEFELH